ncbi:hypothetical protein FOZ60_004143 [Perkinsus olseni]|uniref:Uncharacterized protein n=1 Tax=Perkinsus olseni TaxID=32597 RepID=A0A7J6NUS2_PEROL|nr:hypothetical protein FOZ60_004143 [Perkinsus olseni]
MRLTDHLSPGLCGPAQGECPHALPDHRSPPAASDLSRFCRLHLTSIWFGSNGTIELDNSANPQNYGTPPWHRTGARLQEPAV